MIQTKQSTIIFSVALLLLLILPALLFAQTPERSETANNTTANVEVEVEVSESESDDTSLPSSTLPRQNPGQRTVPPDTVPMERNIDAISPFSGNARATSTLNPISRPNWQERMNLEERKANMKEQIEAKRAEMQANQTERRAALQEKAQERISNFASALNDRMMNAVGRIEQVIFRIESRVEKIKASGVDTSEAERLLAAARADLNTATSILARIDTQVVIVVTSPTPREAWAEVSTTYQSARDAIRSAHSNTKNAVASLKMSVNANVEMRAETANNNDGTSN